MKVLFVCPYPIEIASTRQRVFQYFPYLERKGVSCLASSFITSDFHKIVYRSGRYLQKILFTSKGITRRLRDLGCIADFDVVFIQREAFPFGTTIFERMISAKKPTVYDFDDAIYLMNPAQPSLMPFLRRPAKVATIIQLADYVIAGNEYLANYAAKLNANVEIIPTSINTSYYTPSTVNNDRENLVVGWMGSRTTISYLLLIRDVLHALSERYNIVLKIVANEQINLGFDVVYKQWRLCDELSDLRSFDIGIMPLPDNAWTRAKCGYKIIQYMSVGKPVVASPVGVNRKIIKDGVNGFFAEGKEQWRSRLIELIGDATLRARFGKHGRKTVEEMYSLEVNAPKLFAILESCK